MQTNNAGTGALRPKLSRSISTLNSAEFIEEPHSRYFAEVTIFASVLALIAFWIWAFVTPVYEVVSGEGVVKPKGFVVPVEHSEGGRVARVYAREGQRVSADDIILEFDVSDIQSEIEDGLVQEQNLNTVIARNERILDHDFGTQGSSSGSLGQTVDHLEYRIAQVAHIRAARKVVEVRLVATRLQSERLHSELSILVDRLERNEMLRTQDRVTLAEAEEASLDRLRAEERIERLAGEIEVQRASVVQSIAKERETIARFKDEAEISLVDAQMRVLVVRNTIEKLTRRRNQAVVRAGKAGILDALAVRHAQQIVVPGATIAEIVPQSRDVIAEVEIPADKIGGVKLGAAVKLKVLTHDYARFGHVEAVVSSVAPNSLTKDDGSVVFVVRIALDREALSGPLGAGDQPQSRLIEPGMTVVADIRIGRKTVLAYLIKPLRAISDRAFSEV